MISPEISQIIKSAKQEQKYTLPIFWYLYKILESYNINYTVAYGTLLGTVLYNDIIPWDYDIDIVIDQSDLEKLKSYLNKDYIIIQPYSKLAFLQYIPSRRKIDLFLANSFKYDLYDIQNQYKYNIFHKYKVRIPINYIEILNSTYDNDWKDTCYITNHAYSYKLTKSSKAFNKEHKNLYHQLPVEIIQYYLEENLL